MIVGTGIDMVQISRMRELLVKFGSAFISHTFAPAEIEQAEQARDPAEYYAARFAAKEAVFKAVARHTKRKCFDFRIVETINGWDGCPEVRLGKQLGVLLRETEIDRLHISVTTEGDLAAAFVIAERDCP